MFMIVIAVGEVIHNSLLWFRFNLELEGGDTAPLALRAAWCWNSILNLTSGDQLEEYRAHTLSQSLTMSPTNLEDSFLVNRVSVYTLELSLPFADSPP